MTGAPISVVSGPQRAAAAPLLAQLWRYRWQIWIDFRKDLASQYRDTAGRWLWVVFLPIMPLTVYLLLAAMGVFSTRGGMDGMAYVTVGATLWYLFSGLVTQGMLAFGSKGRTAVRDSYPLIAAVASSYGIQLFEFAVRAVCTFAILAFVQPPHLIGLLLSLPAIIPPLLLFTGFGLIFAMFSVAIHDLQKLVPIFLQYLFFLSLVLFPLPAIGIIPHLLVGNPFAVFIDNIRHLLLLGTLIDPLAFAVWSAIAVVTFLIGLRFFHAAQSRIAEYL